MAQLLRRPCSFERNRLRDLGPGQRPPADTPRCRQALARLRLHANGKRTNANSSA